MSEQKLVSPLLDGFAMGDPMSSHDGVLCCPAMRENSEEKYIVKIISVPASQKQLDALLLTGAYPDAASATDYFKEVADGIVKEAELLKQLSKLEGFLAYDNWQIVPMEGSKLGYQVYLISPYKRSLEKYLNRNTMTHLGAVRLGLDLCAALSICRRAGYMHVDLKPTNIYMTGKREFRIGDLGFVKLSALKFTSLPSKYCSSYTPPELHDALNTLNPTADIYAIGMILYQIFNNGVLPYENKAPASPLPAPLNADYEMAEIILKACDPNPRKRYQTPIEMGKALVGYMQRNTPSDTAIVPPAAQSDFLDASFEPAAEQETAAPQAAEEAEAPVQNEDLAFLEELTTDETAPDTQDAEDVNADALTDDVSSMLAQVEALMVDSESIEELLAKVESEEAAAAVQAPKSVEPEPEPEPEDEAFNFDRMHAPVAVADQATVDEEDDEEPVIFQKKKRKKRNPLVPVLVILLLAALAFGGYYYYQNYFLLTINGLEVTTAEDIITVNVTSDADESLLKVNCTDPSGKVVTAEVVNGTAVFTKLVSATPYKIEVTAEGFHHLQGTCSDTIVTEKLVEILEFSGKTGTEDGSVILNFTADSSELDWIVEYTAEGEETQSVSFTGQTVTISNLTVGKEYTFSLVTAPGSDLYIVGNDTLVHTASRNVIAERLRVISCVDGVLTAQWDTPDDAVVENWTVRCYNDGGYDETVTVSENTTQFSGISLDTAYTMEITASGMTSSSQAFVSANPTLVSEVMVDDSVDGKLTVTWNSGDVIPEGGWLLMYTMGTGKDTMVVSSAENSAVIQPTIPGSTYELNIQAANGSTVFGGLYTHSTAAANFFNDKSISGTEVTASFCPTPGKTNWTYKDISADAYTATYAPGSRVSMVLYSPDKAARSNDDISVMFVIRDSEGNPLPQLTNTVTATWNDLWNNRSRYCSLNLPAIPDEAGQYTVEVYFNRMMIVSKALTITE